MKIFLLLFVLHLAGNSYGQYGSGIVHKSTAPTHNQALSGIPLDGSKAYCYEYFSSYFLSMDLPGFDNILVYNPAPDIGGIDFDQGGNLIAISSYLPVLFRQDFRTSTISPIGSVTGISLDIYSGLAWDAINQIMYGIGFEWSGTWGINSSTLYEINLNTLAATIIGVIPGVDVCLSLAYDALNNQLYTIDFNSGNLIRLNPSNASSTVVGNIGISHYETFFESDFNDQTGDLILSLVTPSDNTNIYSVNLSNANLTLIKTLSDTMLLTAINSTSNPVPIKWYYFLLVFIIPIGLIVRKRLF